MVRPAWCPAQGFGLGATESTRDGHPPEYHLGIGQKTIAAIDVEGFFERVQPARIASLREPPFDHQRRAEANEGIDYVDAASARTLAESGVALSVALSQEKAGQHRKAQDKHLVLLARHRTTEENPGQERTSLKIPWGITPSGFESRLRQGVSGCMRVTWGTQENRWQHQRRS